MHRLRRGEPPTPYYFNPENITWTPNNLNIIYKTNTHSWFNHTEFLNHTITDNNIKVPKFKSNVRSVLRTKRIEIYPNKVQRNILQNWFNIYDYTYNNACKFVNINRNSSKYDCRETLTRSIYNRPWIKSSKIPKHTFDYAIFDLYSARKSFYSNNPGKYFRPRYKKETCNRKIIKLEAVCILTPLKDEKDDYKPTNIGKRNQRFYTKITRLGRIISSETITPVKNNIIIQYVKNTGKYYIYKPESKKTNISPNKGLVCGIDPGECTFQTVYGIDDEINSSVYKIGDGIRNQLNKYYKRIDTTNNKKTKLKMYEKIQNKIDDLHFKTCKWLCDNYKNIVIGKISTSDILVKRNLASKVKRNLQTLSHFTFRQRLKYKCELEGISYKEQNEGYTSKTCSSCGHLQTVNGRVYNCENCNTIMDRDANGARNILLKSL